MEQIILCPIYNYWDEPCDSCYATGRLIQEITTKPFKD